MENLREKNFELFTNLYAVFYSELCGNKEKYFTFLKNKLILFKNHLKYNYFSKYRNLRNEVENKDKVKNKLLEIVDNDIKILEYNKVDWKDFILDIKPLLYVFIDILKEFKSFNEIKKIIDNIFEINSGIMTFFSINNRKFQRYFEKDELYNIMVKGLYESIYKYDPFMKKKKGNMEYNNVLFSGVAYNYIKKSIIDEIMERIHIATLTSEEKIKYIDYYKNLIEKKDNDYNDLDDNNDIEMNYFNNYISLDEFVYDNDEKTWIDFLSDNRDNYEEVNNKMLIEKLLKHLTPEEIYAIFYINNNMSHDEDIMNLLNINKLTAIVNEKHYSIIAKRASDKIKGILNKMID